LYSVMAASGNREFNPGSDRQTSVSRFSMRPSLLHLVLHPSARRVCRLAVEQYPLQSNQR
jgi:hypothetical protein